MRSLYFTAGVEFDLCPDTPIGWSAFHLEMVSLSAPPGLKPPLKPHLGECFNNTFMFVQLHAMKWILFVPGEEGHTTPPIVD